MPVKHKSSKFFKKWYNYYDTISYSPELGKKIENYFKQGSWEEVKKLSKPYIEYAQCHEKIGTLSSRQKAKDSYDYLVQDKYFLNCLPYNQLQKYRSFNI